MQVEWIKTKEELPEKNKKIIIAILHRYSNGRWKWSLRQSEYRLYGKDHHRWVAEDENDYMEPDYWMPFPEPPNMTFEEEKESRRLFLQDKSKNIKIIEEQLAQARREIDEYR